VPPNFLACPKCGRLVHAETLKRLAAEGQAAEEKSDWTAALSAWREVLEKVPPGSSQFETVFKRVDGLSRKLEASGSRPKEPFWRKNGSWVGVSGLAVLALSKLKFLLLGFSKIGTLLTMIAFFGIYWAAWGWRFAGGLVLSIYLHEMGHVARLRHYGIQATAPMFLPGVGALVRLQQRLVNVREDARVGLAGPWWGLGAALACYAAYRLGLGPYWGGIAKVGAWINLFNLLPLGPLDGGRGFRSLTKTQRLLALLGIAAAWWSTKEGLLLFLGGMAIFRVMEPGAPTERDDEGLAQYLILVAALSALCLIQIPGLATDSLP